MPRPIRRSDTASRLTRLERLTARLKEDRPTTVADLAAEFGTSARTITRDLAVLRDQGVPVEAERGRGGGVRLNAHWGAGRLNLSYAEAIDLLISLTMAEQMGSPLFLANLGAVRRQLVASFSPQKRRRVARIKSRILIGETAPVSVQQGAAAAQPRAIRALHQAFVDQEMLRIRYRREDGTETEREIAAHYLLLRYPVWYVAAMDDLRGAPRMFRCDRIGAAQRSGARFALLPVDRFDAPLLGLSEASRA